MVDFKSENDFYKNKDHLKPKLEYYQQESDLCHVTTLVLIMTKTISVHLFFSVFTHVYSKMV